jgi:diguanylate cyclase (GGDEF)-like protein
MITIAMQPLAAYVVGYLSLFLQLGVLALVTVLAAVVRASIGRRIVDGWVLSLVAYTLGVLVVAVAVVGKTAAFTAVPHWIVTTIAYIVFEDLAALGFIVTLRRERGRPPLTIALSALVLAAAATSTFAVVHLSRFFDAYRVHAACLGVLFAVAAYEALRGRQRSPLLAIALGALALDYLHMPLLTLAGVHFASSYVGLESYVTSMLDMALGITIVVHATDNVRRELERRNAELASAEAALRAAVYTDALCGVGNRAAFLERLTTRERRGVVAMIDVDELKAINDRFGHATGDAALAATGRALRERVTDAAVFRIGGDEFVGVWPNGDPDTVGATLCAVERDLGILGEDLAVQPHISWGIAAFDERLSLSDALAIADRALYARKADRRS